MIVMSIILNLICHRFHSLIN